MTYDPGKIMDHHQRLQHESHAGIVTPQRKCDCCLKRRSITQFAGAATTCKQCVLRTPKKEMI
jgi:hypothetical protein